jgi:glutathione peroxidase
MHFCRAGLLLALALTPMAFASDAPPARQKSVYDYSLVGTDGKEVQLGTYKGKVLLIVNLASQSIYENQLAALKDLQAAYADKGLVVLGLPSGDFGSQELADNAAIEHYYKETEHINFPVFAKTSVRGKDEVPLFHYLTDAKAGLPGGDVHWSFTKFVIDREGHAVIRFETDSDPSDPTFKVKIEKVLNGTYKKESPSKGDDAPAGDDEDDPE